MPGRMLLEELVHELSSFVPQGPKRDRFTREVDGDVYRVTRNVDAEGKRALTVVLRPPK